MQIGLNQNIKVMDTVYHVQTEDVEDRNELVSQVFVGGQVLHTYRQSYADWKSSPGWEQKVSQQAHKQHELMLAATARGRIPPKT